MRFYENVFLLLPFFLLLLLLLLLFLVVFLILFLAGHHLPDCEGSESRQTSSAASLDCVCQFLIAAVLVGLS